MGKSVKCFAHTMFMGCTARLISNRGYSTSCVIIVVREARFTRKMSHKFVIYTLMVYSYFFLLAVGESATSSETNRQMESSAICEEAVQGNYNTCKYFLFVY